MGAALLATAGLLIGAVGCGSQSKTEDAFDEWNADDPVPGATLKERRATNSIFGRNEIFATWTLTATPSEKAIVSAMKGACTFDTKAMPRYTLVVDNVTLEVACKADNQAKVAAWWDAVHELPVTSLTFTQGNVTVETDDLRAAVEADVLEDLLAAGAADDLLPDDSVYSVGGLGAGISITAASGLDRELELVHAVVAAGVTGRISVIKGEVIADSSLDVAAARRVEDSANGDGERLLVVGSDKIGWSRVPESIATRNLVDQVAKRSDVERVTIPIGSWDVTTSDAAGAKALLVSLKGADSGAVSELGPLDVGRMYSEADGRCQVSVTLPDTTVPEVLLDACAVPGTDVEVAFANTGEERAAAKVTVSESSIRQTMTVLHRLPEGTDLQMANATDYVRLKVAQPLEFTEGDDTPLAKQLTDLWKPLGPLE